MNTPDHAIADREEPDSSSEPDVPLEPTITCETDLDAPDVDPAWLLEQTTAVIAHLARTTCRATIRIVDDAEMIDLHVRYHDDPTTTDVLTFEGTSEPMPLEVDIAVCLDEARRQSADRSHDVNSELLLYVVHGLLHCSGHDDHDPESHASMHAEEDRILKAIGVGSVYGGGA
ncbi:MAG: rRNA maturation RNase YbeY [Phycisphaerales bacterium]|nr:rRNA maturation RNase YbeY [Phycisphaerales bacterium]